MSRSMGREDIQVSGQTKFFEGSALLARLLARSTHSEPTALARESLERALVANRGVIVEMKELIRIQPWMMADQMGACLRLITNFSPQSLAGETSSGSVVEVEKESPLLVLIPAGTRSELRRTGGDKEFYLVPKALLTALLLLALILLAACSSGPSSKDIAHAATQTLPAATAVAQEATDQMGVKIEPIAEPSEEGVVNLDSGQSSGSSPSPEPSPNPEPTATQPPAPEPESSPTPSILDAMGGLFDEKDALALKNLEEIVRKAPNSWGIDGKDVDLQPQRLADGSVCLVAINRADNQPAGIIILLGDITATEPLAIVYLTDAQAIAQELGLTIDFITASFSTYEGQIVGVDKDGNVVVAFDLATKQWHPAAPPTPEPTSTPTTPEQPAGMIQFDGYTIVYDATNNQWVQKNANDAIRTVWNQTTAKWEIPASVKSIEIGPEGVDRGLAVALSVEEIRKLMEQQPGRIPLPIRINEAGKVKIEEGQSRSQLFRFYNMAGVAVVNPIKNTYTRSNDGRGGGVVILRFMTDNVRYQFCFPRAYENSINPGSYSIGAVIFDYPRDNGNATPVIKTIDPDLKGEFALEGIWGNGNLRAVFEDLLTDPQGRLVVF